MKHYFRLLFVGFILFVLLGLYHQQQDESRTYFSEQEGIEHISFQAGILTLQQEYTTHSFFKTESCTPDQDQQDTHKYQAYTASNHSKIQFVQCIHLHRDIKYTLSNRTGQYLHSDSGKEFPS